MNSPSKFKVSGFKECIEFICAERSGSQARKSAFSMNKFNELIEFWSFKSEQWSDSKSYQMTKFIIFRNFNIQNTTMTKLDEGIKVDILTR